MKSKLALLTLAMLLATSFAPLAVGVKLELVSDGAATVFQEYFGYSTAMGDFNGDGLMDMAIGAPGNDTSGNATGAVYIYYGKGNMAPGELAPSRADVMLTGLLNLSMFGYSIDCAGDINGDTIDDLVVGAPTYLNNQGAAYVFFGGSLVNGTADKANVSMSGYAAGYLLGYAVTGAGDLNGDGLDDIAVSAPGAWRGQVYVFFGQSGMVNTQFPDLWELPQDRPQPADFTSGLNSTGNTWGLAGADDGWDWAAGVFGGTDPNVAFFNPNGGVEDALHVRVGGISTGNGQNNNNLPASAGYGLKINITGPMWWAIQNGSWARLSFDYRLWDEQGLDGQNQGEVAWLKASITNSTGRYYFGSDQDSWAGGPNDDSVGAVRDPTPELYYYYWGNGNPYTDQGQYLDDITQYITGPGFIYLDFGAKEGDWSNNAEWFHAYFDNITLMISPLSWPDVNLLGPGVPRFGSVLECGGDINGDGYSDLLVGEPSADMAWAYFGSPRMALEFDLHEASITPNAKNAFDNTNEPIGDVQSDNGVYYTVDRTNQMYFDSFGITNLYGVLNAGEMYVNYNTGQWYSGNNFVRYSLPGGTLSNTNIRPQASTGEQWAGPFDIVAAGARNATDLGSLKIEFTNNDGQWNDPVNFDFIYIYVVYSAFPNMTLRGQRNSQFGASLAPMGDLDGDGLGDFAVGAPNVSAGTGEVRLFRGRNALTTFLNYTESNVTLTGSNPADLFGYSLASGLVSLDTVRDLVVGLPGASAVAVFNGSSAMANTTVLNADAVVRGQGPNDVYGFSVTAGDVNGLGCGEILVGAPKFNTNTGKAYLYDNADEKVANQPLLVTYTPAFDPTINEMENQTFGFNVTNALSEFRLTSQWYIDGVQDTGPGSTSLTYFSNYTSAGVHNITVRISDGQRTAQHTWTLTVINVNGPPTVVWDPPGDMDIDEGMSIVLSATAWDPDGDTIVYAWTLNGAPMSLTTNSFNFTTNYSSAGTYVYALNVSDGNGHAASHNWTINVRNMNRPPVIDTRDPQLSDMSIEEGTDLKFSITAHDPDADPLAVIWYFGGRMVAIDTLTYTVQADFRSAGTKEMKAVVSDGELTVVATWSLTILNVNAPPVIDAFNPLLDVKISEGDKSSFWIAAHDPDGDPLTVSWFVDSEANVTGYYNFAFLSSHDSASTYTIQVRVSDGQAATSLNWTLHVNHAPIITTYNPKDDLVYLQLGQEAFVFVTPYDPDSDPLVTSWYLDDRYQAGASGNSERFVVGPSSVGTFRLKAIVSDGSLAAYHEWTVVVNASVAKPPVPVIDMDPRDPKANQEVVCTGKNTQVFGKLTIVNYTWDFGDGTIAYGMDVSHSYKDAGTYTVRLTVTDSEGNKATTASAIAVSPAKAATQKSEMDWGLPVFGILMVLFIILLVAAMLQRSTQKKLEGPAKEEEPEGNEDDTFEEPAPYKPKKLEPLPDGDVIQRFDDDGNLMPKDKQE
jgi:hypothetical protein